MDKSNLNFKMFKSNKKTAYQLVDGSRYICRKEYVNLENESPQVTSLKVKFSRAKLRSEKKTKIFF